MVDLLPLEHGHAVRGCRNPRLQSRLLSFSAGASASDHVDLVLLAGATAVLQEASESQAAFRALEMLALHPERVGLAELAKSVDENDDVLRPMVNRYLMFAGYEPNPIGAFRVIGDIYLGRVHRKLAHPVLGAACVAYFSNAGCAEPAIGSTTACCARMWADWQAEDGDLDSIERQAKQFADDWVIDRVRFLQGAGLDLPAALRCAQ